MDPPSQESTPTSTVYNNMPGCEEMPAEGEGGFLHPPTSSDEEPQPETQSSYPNLEVPSLSKDAAQEAFVTYASDKCCFSTKPAEEGVITNMEAFVTYRYILDTFTEARSTEWSLRPHYGEHIDTSDQTPPGAWEIPVTVPALFEDGKHITEVPHTASVKDCIRCDVTGRIGCVFCNRSGRRMCHGCGGCGFHSFSGNRQTCFLCGGLGNIVCLVCNGTGWTICDTCMGQRKVVASINLIVQWTNYKDKHTGEQSSGLKMVKLDKVPGVELFTESKLKVQPITSFPDPTVLQTSEKLVSEHQDKYAQTSHILQQRQTIEMLPITKVTYEWKEKPHVFFVYGRDSKVSAVDYPAACCGFCCCCTLL